ncbi:terpene synthase metal binding domain protein [Aspergillus ambiguus]|uniref:terpene synthase family protein n=1 Tax=Aspergillus ambiguus TaxID=176160 RepID=UPI003CCD570A
MSLLQVLQSAVLPAGKSTDDDYIPVHLPNMFVLFLSGHPNVNPYYETVRRESEVWLSNKCSFGERAQRILFKTDFSYFCSISAPYAGAEELRTVCDWGNWVFPFDDMFDNGGLKDDPERAEKLINSLLEGMDNDGVPPHSENCLVQTHNTVWERVAKGSPVGVRRRFANAMKNYCTGTLEQVKNCSNGDLPTLQEMLDLRRQSSGVSPLFALIEYAHKLDLPDAVFESRSIKEIERLGIDLVLLQNDILSYCKEEKEGVTHNMVAICRRGGMPAQMAFDHIGEMLVACYRDWYMALAELPSWGERIDAEVQRYIQGVQHVVMANLNWSFRSGRYFGKANDQVRKTGVVMVRPQKVDLELSMLNI